MDEIEGKALLKKRRMLLKSKKIKWLRFSERNPLIV
jgi:hypothetical protein